MSLRFLHHHEAMRATHRRGWLGPLAALLLALGSSSLAAGDVPSTSLRLGGRHTIGESDIVLSQPDTSASFTFPCDVKVPVLKAEGDYAEYRPDWDGRGGHVEVLVRRWKTSQPLDRNIRVDIHHRGKTGRLHIDANTQQDEWLSLGRFDFDGTPEEFVRLTREQRAGNAITPALTIRLDVYYDTKPRKIIDADRAVLPAHGFSRSGLWTSTTDSQPGTLITTEAGATATWNPCLEEPGTYGVYVYKPNVEAGDVYEIWHAGQVDHVDLRDVCQSNTPLGNPRATQGWFKIGEFEFDASSVEGLRLVKTEAGTETSAGDVYFERVELDGTILHRTHVPATELEPYTGEALKEKSTQSLAAKVEASRLPPGFSPQTPAEPSSKVGATVYARPLYLRSVTTPFHWNPCITTPGTYEVRYFTYWPVKEDGEFRVNHAGEVKVLPVKASDLKPGTFHSLGSFAFAGDGTDEFVEMIGIDRASELVFERKVAGGRIARQTWVTVHPYFKEIRYEDTIGLPNAHDISFMVQKGALQPKTKDRFEPAGEMTVDAFLAALQNTVRLRDAAAAKALITLPTRYGWRGSEPIAIYQANVLCEDALAFVGRYANVSNFGVVDMQEALGVAPELQDVPASHRFSQARLAALEIVPFTPASRAAMQAALTRAHAASMLKNLLEQGIGSGPPVDADWEMSFQDEFKSDQIDWAKWKPRHGVRFKGYSAIWAENCSARDGLLVLGNYMDNKVVPYSTASLTARQGQVHGFFEARHNYPDRAYGSHTSFWFSAGEAGDFNVNEGTYPNHISNNNYFMTPKEVPELKKGPANFNNFAIDTNFAHDFHTISGYLDDKDLFYGLDGQITYAVKDYLKYYADKTKSTNYPYAPIISSVITYFDGPLDRDRIDGSAVLVDWVRSYRKAAWQPSLVEVARIVDSKGNTSELQLRFDKRMRPETVSTEAVSVLVDDTHETNVRVEMLTPMKFRFVFAEPIAATAAVRLRVGTAVVDERNQPLAAESEVELSVGQSVSGPARAKKSALLPEGK